MTAREEKIMIEEERYKRQTLLWGEEGQARLANARVAVVGLGPQGIYTALCLTSLGVGNIVLIDGTNTEKKEMLLDMEVSPGTRALNYPSLLKKINSQVNLEGYPTNLDSRISQMTLENSTAIVDATNSVKSKELAVAYGMEKNIPVLSTSSRPGYTKLMLCSNIKDPSNLMPMFEGQGQDPLMALAMCGIIAEEVRKTIFDERENFLREPVRYRLGAGYRFGFPAKEEISPVPDPQIYSKLKVAFLGGGALGCWGAIAGAIMGFERLDVFDYDTFESHNINRQVLAYDGIGKLKALHVAEKIEKMGRTKSAGKNVLIVPGFETEIKYDLVFDFVDNRYTRAVNTAYASSHGIPMISAGALPYSARWDTHVPGKTKCLDCLYDIYEEGRKEEMIKRASCAANPDPSVVMSNAIAANNAILETFTIFEPEKFGEPFNGEQSYRSASPKRFGTSPMPEPCDCHSRPAPVLEISQDDVKKFARENPELLREAR